MAKLKFCGAARTVTGSCFLVEAGDSRVLVDCGLFQGSKEVKENNYGGFPFDAADIDFLLLTHAHIDHCGLIPGLYRRGFRGRIIATPPTCELCKVLLPDSAYIQEMEVERKNRKARRAGRSMLQPIYTVQEAYDCLRLFQPVEYEKVVQLDPSMKACFYEAGHILGSASIKLWVREGDEEATIVFSGDLGRPNQPLVKDPAPPDVTDYLVMESTYGARFHSNSDDSLHQLERIINKTIEHGGNVIIPAFAVERTQDMLFSLGMLIKEGRLKPERFFLDSPLAVAATEIFCRYISYLDEETQAAADQYGKCPLLLPGLHLSRSAEESMAINKIHGGAVILAASGMCDAGRIKHHLKHNLWRPECTVILVGYQAAGTLGRRLYDGAEEVTIHGEQIAVRARIERMDYYSAHADQEGLVNWVKQFRQVPERIFLTHGEEEALEVLGARLTDELKATVTIPLLLEEVSLPLFPVQRIEVPVVPEAMPEVAATAPSLRDLQNEFYALRQEFESWYQRKVEAAAYLEALKHLRHWRQEVKDS